MQSFNDYSSCDGAYPWMGARNCQGSACEWIDGATITNAKDALLHAVAAAAAAAAATAVIELTWARYVAGTAWDYTGPNFSVDDAFLHFYTNGNWGTWGDGHTAIGACPCAEMFRQLAFRRCVSCSCLVMTYPVWSCRSQEFVSVQWAFSTRCLFAIPT